MNGLGVSGVVVDIGGVVLVVVVVVVCAVVVVGLKSLQVQIGQSMK